jgi:hypothetical protein
MDISGKRTGIIVLIGILWIVITVLGWKNYAMAGMYLGVVLMLLHMMLGAANNGRLSSRMFLYPLLVWAVLWCLSFFLSRYHADLFAGRVPDFTIVGLHPSFAWTVITYWLGGVATLTVGFILLQDEWLSEKDWNAFKEKIKMLEKGEVN